MKEKSTALLAGSLVAAGIAALVWSLPSLIPDNYRHAAGIAPTAAAYQPFFHTEARALREEIDHRFSSAPDIIHAMAIGVALDPGYPAARVEELASDLLLPSYKSDIERVLGGKNIATHTSILSVAVEAGRMDIAQIILERGGVANAEAHRVAIKTATSLQTRPSAASRTFIEIFASAGGQPHATRSTKDGRTLAEILLEAAPELLLLFERTGFDPWSSLDPAQRSLGGMSLAELAARNGNSSQLSGLSLLLSKSRATPSPEVLENLKGNLLARAKNPAHIESLLQKLENREGRRLTGQFLPSQF